MKVIEALLYDTQISKARRKEVAINDIQLDSSQLLSVLSVFFHGDLYYFIIGDPTIFAQKQNI